MSIISRIALAGLACASLGIVQAAPTAAKAAAPAGDNGSTTRGRLFHASKCVVTFGFSGDCDKDAAESTLSHPAETKTADNSTRHRFFHASKCVVSLGFSGGCDGDTPAGASSPAPARRAEAAPAAAPDTSTRGRLMHASKCVATLGFGGGCDQK